VNKDIGKKSTCACPSEGWIYSLECTVHIIYVKRE